MKKIRGESDPPRVVIADDSGLIFSDDYRRGWVSGFKAVGCEVHVVDIRPMAKHARQVMGTKSVHSMRGNAYMPRALARQIAKLKPDLVWFHHGRSGSVEVFQRELRSQGIPSCVYLCDEPYEVGETAHYSRSYSHVFSLDPCTIPIHQHGRKDRNVFYLPPAVDTTLFRPIRYEDRSGPTALFLGNGTLTPRQGYLEPIQRIVEGADIRYMYATHKNKREWVPLEQHPQLYGNCRVGLNIHRAPWMTEACWKTRVLGRKTPMAPGIQCHSKPTEFGTGFWNDANAPAAHWNPRFLEMAACGTLVVNDASRSELAREFPFVPQAEDPAHFLELVLYYAQNTTEAEEVGWRCLERISSRHTYAHRAAEVLIRLGLQARLPDNVCSSLGEPQDFLTPQPSTQPGAPSLSGRTGPSERWSPQHGLSSIDRSGLLSDTD